jgi:selenophosphate synthase
VLFLGAGASKTVDIGDLKDLTNKVRGYGKLLDHIQDTLKKANIDSRFFNQGETDLEVIFSILNSRIDPVDALKNLGPYSIYINELREQSELPYADQLQNKEEMDNLKETIEKVIVSQCNKFKLDKATKYYDDCLGWKETLLNTV